VVCSMMDIIDMGFHRPAHAVPSYLDSSWFSEWESSQSTCCNGKFYRGSFRNCKLYFEFVLN
jgi:hypothetical protein